MSKVYIIGGGASGLIAAINSAKAGNDVTIIEKNNKLGKKLLITGNGKCNYWNEDISINHYNTNNPEILKSIINESNQQQVLTLFNKLGIIPYIKNGYYYPLSNQAITIQNTLLEECLRLNINIIYEEEVQSIFKDNNKFIINTNKNKFIGDKVILSTGSYSAPQTGSDGIGYKLAKSLGHSIIKPLPALTGLICKEKYLKDWAGIRTNVKLSLYEDNNLLKKETGELQLTNYGISGICTFNLSSLISRGLYNNKEEIISINFLHPLNISNTKEFISWMNKRITITPNYTIQEILDKILNYKLVNIILSLSKISNTDTWNNIPTNKKELLSNNFINFKLKIIDTNNFNNSQTTTGGIPLSEINPNTMESLKCNNFYITGELLDADGECGGFNLAFAFITGFIAGKGGKNDKNK